MLCLTRSDRHLWRLAWRCLPAWWLAQIMLMLAVTMATVFVVRPRNRSWFRDE